MFYKDISFFYVCKEFADFQKFLQKLCEDCLIIRIKDVFLLYYKLIYQYEICELLYGSCFDFCFYVQLRQ